MRSLLPVLGGLFLPLVARRASALNSTELQDRDLCLLGQNHVTACAESDVTKENWDKFGIDLFLAGFINQFGTATNFPDFFFTNQALPGHEFDGFDCQSFDRPKACGFQAAVNPKDNICEFEGLQGTLCNNFQSPEAGYVLVNYIRIFQSLHNNYVAIRQASDAMIASDFVNRMVDNLAERKAPIAPAVFNLLADLVTDILPVGGEIKAATKFAKKMRIVLKATKSDLKDDSKDIVSVLENNEEIQIETAANRDQMALQFQYIVDGAQRRILKLQSNIFGASQDPKVVPEEQVTSTSAFLHAQHGVFLDDVPDVDGTARQIQFQMQAWLVSRMLKVLNYAVTVDTTPIEDPDRKGNCQNGQHGVFLANGCGFFRIGVTGEPGQPDQAFIEDAPQANNIFFLRDIGLDFNDVVGNAVECQNAGGGSVDFDEFLDADVDDRKFPRCLFDFPVVTGRL